MVLLAVVKVGTVKTWMVVSAPVIRANKYNLITNLFFDTFIIFSALGLKEVRMENCFAKKN